MLRSNSKQSGKSIQWILKEKKEREDMQKRKDLSLEWKCEWVMEYQYQSETGFGLTLSTATSHQEAMCMTTTMFMHAPCILTVS